MASPFGGKSCRWGRNFKYTPTQLVHQVMEYTLGADNRPGYGRQNGMHQGSLET